MIVELANKFRFKVDSFNEVLTGQRIPSLHLHSTINVNSLKAADINENFDGKTLSSIKVYEDENSTAPFTIFTDYINLAHFERNITGVNCEVTIILSAPGAQSETSEN